jgi:TorA maturation chaperone TorD
MTEAPESALAIGAWSHVWSSAVSVDLRRAAWEALELPESFEDCKQEYWNVFQVGSDGPRISLLLHHALGRPGSSVREDWLRVMNHLGLQWNEVHLPPDQLGAACEVYACAIARNEPVLIEELRERYLLPWCEIARGILAADNSRLAFLPEHFEQDLRAAGA